MIRFALARARTAALRRGIAVLLALLPTSLPAQSSSSRNCAICHFSWMPAFLEQGRSGQLAALPPNNVVISEAMCFSCHDGSVVDSRRGVFLEHGHTTGIVPPHDMEIPRTLPLSGSGEIFCGTCHTAHGTDMARTEIANAIFLRMDNTNSELCVACHRPESEHLESRNHSVDVNMPGAWPQALDNTLAVRGQRFDVVCQSCHAAHGSAHDNLLVLPVRDSSLCAACHPDRATMGDLASPINHPPLQGCLTCHSVHGGASEKGLLVMDNTQDGLCLYCHTDMDAVESSRHALRETAPDLENDLSRTPASAGSCSGCHTPHGALGPRLWARRPVEGEQGESALCLTCHGRVHTPEVPSVGSISHPTEMRPIDGMSVGNLPLYGRDIRTSRDGEIMCSTCHSVHHTELRADNTADAMCRICHAQEYRALSGGHHDFTEGGDAARPCSECHVPHRGNGPMLWAQELGADGTATADRLCRSCHGDSSWPEAPSPTSHLHPVSASAPDSHGDLPLFNLTTAHRSDAGGVTCLTCHAAHDLPLDAAFNTRLDPRGEAPLCVTCHPQQGAIAQSGHDLTGASPAAQETLGIDTRETGVCRVCHRFLDEPATGQLYRSSALLPGPPDAVANLCQTCHRAQGVASAHVVGLNAHRREFAPPPERRPDHLPLFDEEGRRSDSGMLTCATCHDPHRPPRADSDFGFFLRPAQGGDPALCMDCHHDRRWIAGTDHDLRLSAPAERNDLGKTASEVTLCAACHLAHPPNNNPLLWGHALGPGGDFVTRACTGCHQPSGPGRAISPEAVHHPSDVVVLEAPPGISLYDAEGHRGHAGQINCATCHNPHQWNGRQATEGSGAVAEGNPLTSFTRPDVPEELCSSCHGREALVRYLLYHHGQTWGRTALVPWRSQE